MLQKLSVEGLIELSFSNFHLCQNLKDYCVSYLEFLTCISEVGPGNLHSNIYPDVDAACLANTAEEEATTGIALCA